jgi:hypothetical protein
MSPEMMLAEPVIMAESVLVVASIKESVVKFAGAAAAPGNHPGKRFMFP